MSKFLRDAYAALEPYTPGEQPRSQTLLKLNTNENPYGPSPNVLQAISREEISKLMLYPDPAAGTLVNALAETYHVAPEQVMAGNGSDEILAFCFMAFQNPRRKLYFPAISYGFYPVYGAVFQADWTPVPLREDLTIRIGDYENLDGTIIIANPNAPTGIALERADMERILRANRGNLVIVDEAYVDFGAESCVPLIHQYDNLLVIQTFSKSRSLAGGRIGFAIGDRALIEDLNRLKFSFNPYTLNRLSIAAAVAALRDRAYFETTRGKIMAARETLTAGLSSLGFTVLPSKANFIFAKSNRLSGLEYFTKLRENNIIVRHFNKEPVSQYVRITIGRDRDMEQLLQVTADLLRKG